jgi:hypothetical protein
LPFSRPARSPSPRPPDSFVQSSCASLLFACESRKRGDIGAVREGEKDRRRGARVSENTPLIPVFRCLGVVRLAELLFLLLKLAFDALLLKKICRQPLRRRRVCVGGQGHMMR